MFFMEPYSPKLFFYVIVEHHFAKWCIHKKNEAIGYDFLCTIWIYFDMQFALGLHVLFNVILDKAQHVTVHSLRIYFYLQNKQSNHSYIQYIF